MGQIWVPRSQLTTQRAKPTGEQYIYQYGRIGRPLNRFIVSKMINILLPATVSRA
jgi:hypothetical protein